MISPPFFPTGLLWLALGLIISLSINLASKRISSTTHYYTCISYRVAIPYLGLLTGVVSPYLMGLSNIDWATSLGIGAGLSFAVVLVLALIKMTLQSSQSHSKQENSEPQPSLPAHTLPFPNSYSAFANRHFFAEAVWSIAEQFYWAFNRASIWEFLLRIEPNIQVPAYHALWITGLIALPDMLMHTKNQQNRISSLCIFVATSILFFFTHNFWLCVSIHLAMAILLHPSPSESSSAIKINRSRSLPQIEARTR